MPASHSSPEIHYWAGRYPGRIGWLVGPADIRKTRLRKWIPFALDNAAFAAFKSGQPWSEDNWMRLLHWVGATGLEPLWALVPDVVGNRDATISLWDKYRPEVLRRGWRMAFAVQDGMTPADVPRDAHVVFVGGTTDWKWRYLRTWTSSFPIVHVGRVNELHRLQLCEELRVASVDGTGWFRGTINGRQGAALEAWISGIPAQPCLL